jgi:propanol-preferring alcohol dehydrogenase
MAGSMVAFRLIAWQRPAEFVEVPVPRPGPGEVLVRMGGVGLCRSDLLFLDAAAGRFDYELPFTLGHENAGWVDQLGPGVSDLAPGDAVVTDQHRVCGRCTHCWRGQETYCEARARGRGSGLDGGLAAYLVVPARQTVRLRQLDPRRAAPLADAGRTSYHAVRRVLPRLVPGSHALVIGAGGLGGYAVQWLRALCPSRVIAADVLPHRLQQASKLGAHETLVSDDSLVEAVRLLTGGPGVEAVFDFVGSDATMAAALRCAAPLGAVAIVGAAGGSVEVSWESLPPGCDLFISRGGTLADLQDVVALAEQGAVRTDVELFDFSETPQAYDHVRAGDLPGRAVVSLAG